MGVKRGNLVHLGEREAHLLGQRHEMAREEAAIAVLQQVQVLDQQVATPLAVAEQRLHLGQGGGIDLPALRRVAAAPPAGAGMDAAVVLSNGRLHTPITSFETGRRRSPSALPSGKIGF